MTKEETTQLLEMVVFKIVKEANSKEDAGLSGVLALVAATYDTGDLLEMMHELMPFAKKLKEKRFRDCPCPECEKEREAKTKGEHPQWPDEIEGKVM